MSVTARERRGPRKGLRMYCSQFIGFRLLFSIQSQGIGVAKRSFQSDDLIANTSRGGIKLFCIQSSRDESVDIRIIAISLDEA